MTVKTSDAEKIVMIPRMVSTMSNIVNPVKIRSLVMSSNLRELRREDVRRTVCNLQANIHQPCATELSGYVKWGEGGVSIPPASIHWGGIDAGGIHSVRFF
jgi:hypothetical protein